MEAAKNRFVIIDGSGDLLLPGKPAARSGRTFACGTAYLIRPTESNDPACGYLAMASDYFSHR